MRIGELSANTGVSISTIRLYEREGLIAPAARTEGRFREFTPEQERRLSFIKRLRRLGFSLDDVKALLSLQSAGWGEDTAAVMERARSDIAIRQGDLELLDRRLAVALEEHAPAQDLEDTFTSSRCPRHTAAVRVALVSARP